MSRAAKSAFKVVLLGDVGVGKTSLLVRFVDDSWDHVMDSTIGQTFLKSTLQVHSEEVVLHLWDTPGSERYSSTNTILMRDADCCIIVYDVSDPEHNSYQFIPKIIDRYRSACGVPGTFVVVVGNKCDKIASRLQDDELQRLSDAQTEFWVNSFLASAKSGEGVKELFQFVASKLVEQNSSRMIHETAPGIDLTRTQKNKNRGDCC
jgi:small GTP-binding protein